MALEKHRTLIGTSINPFARLDHQIRCFRRWKDAGFGTITFNVQDESNLLFEQGLSSDEVRTIPVTETVSELHGKPIPRIIVVLEYFLRYCKADNYILTNADIFPAVRSSRIASFLSQYCSDGLAMTREECHEFDGYTFQSEAPYRGGLDAFCMTRPVLERLVGMLNELRATRRMAFGIPGWDFLVGAAMISDQVGGKIMDSGVLLHATHRQTYQGIDEFQHYVDDMSALGAATKTDFAGAAREFADRIDQECRNNRPLTEAVKLLHFNPDMGRAEISAPNRRIAQVVADFEQLMPDLGRSYRRTAMMSVGARVVTEGEGGFAVAVCYFVLSSSNLQRFAEMLIAIAFCLRCRREFAGIVCKREYPSGNRHSAALRQVLGSTHDNAAKRRLGVLELFGGELVDHGIFNARLFDYLVLCTENRHERKLMSDILKSAWRAENAA